MEDLSFLFQYINLVTLGICLCVGFALKQAFSWFHNRYIPLTMLVFGTLINVITNLPNINAIILLEGMISGLASTGFYEMLRNLLRNDEKKEGENDENNK